MRTGLVVLMVLSGILFVGAVMLMTPKGGLGAIAGMAGGSDYGSKKSVESTLKKVAYVTSVIFVVCSLLIPYSE